MAIISRNKRPGVRLYSSNQFRYSLVYVFITFAVLLFLNIYCSGANQKLFYQSKEVAMLEKCQLAATEIAELEVLNPNSAASAIKSMDSFRVSRLIITDQSGVALPSKRIPHMTAA